MEIVTVQFTKKELQALVDVLIPVELRTVYYRHALMKLVVAARDEDLIAPRNEYLLD